MFEEPLTVPIFVGMRRAASGIESPPCYYGEGLGGVINRTRLSNRPHSLTKNAFPSWRIYVSSLFLSITSTPHFPFPSPFKTL